MGADDDMLAALQAYDAVNEQPESGFLGLGFCDKYCKSLGYKGDKAGYKQCKADCRSHKKEIKQGTYSIPSATGKMLEDELRKPVKKAGMSGFTWGLIIFAVLLFIAAVVVGIKRMRS